MEVILREDVPSLGATGDVVKVRPGYARNYLLPRGLAVLADRRNIQVLEHNRRVVAAKRDRDRQQAQTLAEQMGKLRLVIQERAGEEGKLFGSVTNQDVERALAKSGFPIDRRKIRLDEPLKALGEYTVPVHLGAGVDAQITVVVEALE
jgi:large subunit ribosomal protein L9